jgi:UDP-N-acetylmuramate--alanine ligase
VTSDAAAIGAGLDPVRAARPIHPGERIHVVGAGGAGASAAALLAHAAGAIITACDRGGPSPYTAALHALGVAIANVHDPAHVTTAPPPDRLAVTKALTAIDADNAELRTARDHGISVEPWQQVIADAAAGRTLVAVAGTHGKSTTAGWLVHVLTRAGLDPSGFVGALLASDLTDGPPATARIGRGAPFVVEADEYAGNFDAYRPTLVVLTSAEWDHPDVFADAAAVERAFLRWLEAMPTGGTVVANVGDLGVAAVVDRLTDGRLSILPVRLGEEGAVPGSMVGRILSEEPGGTTLELRSPGHIDVPVTVRLPTAGRHNAANALGVAGAALTLGVPPASIVRGLETFGGVGRRLERKGEANDVVVYDDYGHHPTAIRATIEAMRQREPGRRLWAVYEPLTYHRTAALLREFADALATADAVAIADIWAGRDPDTTIASSSGLAAAVAERRADIQVEAPGSVEATADRLADQVRPGDAVLVMGGGHSYMIATGLLRRLEETSRR